MSDTDDALIVRLRARASAVTGEPRLVPLAADMDGLLLELLSFLPPDTVAVYGYEGHNINGRLDAEGAGYIVEAFPYGGSVIDGYNLRLTAVLPSGAVLLAEGPDLGPCVARVYGDSPDIRTIIERAEEGTRTRPRE